MIQKQNYISLEKRKVFDTPNQTNHPKNNPPPEDCTKLGLPISDRRCPISGRLQNGATANKMSSVTGMDFVLVNNRSIQAFSAFIDRIPSIAITPEYKWHRTPQGIPQITGYHPRITGRV